jgi:AcrR family transcriptional regulator
MTDGGREASESGREATTAAILDAAEDLFSSRGFSAVSVRAIAERAGISHALVHRYIGRKIDIWSAVVERNARGILQAAPDNPDILATTSLMLRSGLAQYRRYIRLVAYSALHGPSSGFPTGMYGATERLVELAERVAASASSAEQSDESLDPRFVIACVDALFFGWITMESWLLKRTGLEDMDETEVVDGVERVMLGILRDNLPGLERNGPTAR